jgi:hypothetical protein
MMTQDEWHCALKAHWLASREATPLPDRESLSPELEEQCRIIGGALFGWLETNGPYMLEQRQELEAYADSPEPIFILLTTLPGLLAAEDIAGSDQERLFYMLPETWAEFSQAHPDETMRHHIINCSSVRELEDDERLPPEISRPAEGSLWVHEEATTVAPNFTLGAHHLWHWDGSQAELTQEAFRRVMAEG